MGCVITFFTRRDMVTEGLCVYVSMGGGWSWLNLCSDALLGTSAKQSYPRALLTRPAPCTDKTCYLWMISAGAR